MHFQLARRSPGRRTPAAPSAPPVRRSTPPALTVGGRATYAAAQLELASQLGQLLLTDVAILLVVRGSVFRYSDKALVLAWLAAVSLATTAFCFLVATFFSRAKVGARYWYAWLLQVRTYGVAGGGVAGHHRLLLPLRHLLQPRKGRCCYACDYFNCEHVVVAFGGVSGHHTPSSAAPRSARALLYVQFNCERVVHFN
jgi:hypothetical protein